MGIEDKLNLQIVSTGWRRQRCTEICDGAREEEMEDLVDERVESGVGKVSLESRMSFSTICSQGCILWTKYTGM